MGQLAIKFPATWGGRRRNAGRRPNGDSAGVPHLRRENRSAHHPVHVTLRMRPGVWNLRSRRSFSRLYASFLAGKDRFGFRLCAFGVLGNHIHLLVEAKDANALARGMQGLSIRIAKALNKMMNRSGAVFADRYHSRVLKTPTEVRRARRYLATNAHEHGLTKRPFTDPYCSFTLAPTWRPLPVCQPSTWLLRKGWQRGSPTP